MRLLVQSYKLDVHLILFNIRTTSKTTSFTFLEGPGAMVGSAIIGGFILAMIEGTGILINRYSQMLMPAPEYQGSDISFSYKTHLISFLLRNFT